MTQRVTLHIAESSEDKLRTIIEDVFTEFKKRPTWRRRQELRDELIRAVHRYCDSKVIPPS